MAILNYANTFQEVKGNLLLPESNTGDYIKLIFTKDGHIITHGYDYTKDYSAGVRGLVPDYISSLSNNGVLSKNGWSDILSVLPIAEDIVSGDTTHIPTNDQITKYISNSIKTAETLRFKGGIGYKDSSYYHIPVEGVEKSGFPENCKVGDSYRILTNNTTIAGSNDCQAGDMIICIKDTTGAQTGSEYWMVIQANIEGTSEVTINGLKYQFYTGSINQPKSIYAPSTKGTSGNILISSGNNTPIWGTLSISDTGKLTVTSDSTTYINQNIIANKLQKALKAGVGITGNDFDGSSQQTWNLNVASRTTLGGVLIDNTVGNYGTDKSTISINADGRIFLDKDNISNALGYIPVDPSNASLYKLTLGEINSTTNAITNVTNPYINLVGTDTTNIQISGSGRISVLGNNGKVTIALQSASTSLYGGIKVSKVNDSYTVAADTSTISSNITSGKFYGVEIDKNGQAFVYVPWKNRDITINKTSIGDNTLNFVPTGDIYIKADVNNDNVVDLSFGLSWFNISANNGAGAYEYDSQTY